MCVHWNKRNVGWGGVGKGSGWGWVQCPVVIGLLEILARPSACPFLYIQTCLYQKKVTKDNS